LKRFVVDASVAIKWFVEEPYSAEADRLLSKSSDLWAPDLIWAEAGNILWKKWRRNEISREEARAVLQDLRRFPIRVTSSEQLSDSAWVLAADLSRSFYDSLYMALAVSHSCPMVTADERLWNAVRGKGPDILWVGEM
jgi:predicted nucleic acid-binding protein